jgi:hypothetical protein
LYRYMARPALLVHMPLYFMMVCVMSDAVDDLTMELTIIRPDSCEKSTREAPWVPFGDCISLGPSSKGFKRV